MRKILGLLLLLPGWAQACLFATSTSPEGWHQWSKQLKVQRPTAGARVLVGINPHGDAMLVPLSDSYAEQLRQQRVKQPRP